MNGRPRVLVIDDEPVMHRVMVRALRDYEVIVQADAREALALLAAGNAFDAILCDLNMPGMNGMQFQAALTPAQADRLLFHDRRCAPPAPA
jgi:two-component system, NtrC family, sensor kinase